MLTYLFLGIYFLFIFLFLSWSIRFFSKSADASFLTPTKQKLFWIFAPGYSLLVLVLSAVLSFHGDGFEYTLLYSLVFCAIAVSFLGRVYASRIGSMLFFLFALGILFLLATSIITFREYVFDEVSLRLFNRELEIIKTETQVLDMMDETLVSDNGNSIGMRLKYTIRFPKDYFGEPYDFFDIQPSKDSGIADWNWISLIGGDMHVTRVTIEPKLVERARMARMFEKGKTYSIVAEYIPSFIRTDLNNVAVCIETPPQEEFWDSQTESYRMYTDVFPEVVQNTQYFRLEIISNEFGFDELTKNTYRYKDFYESFKKEGLSECEKES